MDDVIGPIYDSVTKNVFPTKLQCEELNSNSKILPKPSPKLFMEGGLLMRSTKLGNQIVLPKVYHRSKGSGPAGADRVTDAVRNDISGLPTFG